MHTQIGPTKGEGRRKKEGSETESVPMGRGAEGEERFLSLGKPSHQQQDKLGQTGGFGGCLQERAASCIAQLVKYLRAVQQTRLLFLGQEVPLEKEMQPHSIILAMDRGAWWATVRGIPRVRHDVVS